LAGVRLQEATDDFQGIVFVFASQSLAPGNSLVVVKNRAAFQSRYGAEVAIALGDDGLGGLPGEFANQLGNGGETLTLVAAAGTLIQQLTYDDEGDWPEQADGAGSSLEWIVATGDPNAATAWRASDRFGGSPGAPNQVIAQDIVINEIRPNSDAPLQDAIELFNRTGQAINVSGWYVSDSGNNPLRYRLPAGSIVPARGYLALDQQDFLFNLRGEAGDDAYLIAADPAGRPERTADYVQFGPTQSNVSLGRYPDGEGTMLPLSTASFGQANSPPTAGSRGDFNLDGAADGVDLRLLCAALHNGHDGRPYDLNGDEQLNHGDLEIMVRDILKSVVGDANWLRLWPRVAMRAQHAEGVGFRVAT
jgi:hypothetical protein